MDIEKLQLTAKNGNIEWRKHVLIRLAERNISQNVILEVVINGEIIETYPDDKPFPSCLIFKFIGDIPYHVVAGFNLHNEKTYIITVYNPDLNRFKQDFKTRRK